MLGRVGGEAVTGDDVDGRQYLGERAHQSGFRGALLAAHEHAPDAGVDDAENKRQRHVVEPTGRVGVAADDGGKRVQLIGRGHSEAPLVVANSGTRGRYSD